jgi:hypothetical protein
MYYRPGSLCMKNPWTARIVLGILSIVQVWSAIGCRTPLYLEEWEGQYLVEVRERGDIALGDEFAAYELVKKVQPLSPRSAPPASRRVNKGKLRVVGFLDNVHVVLELVDGYVEPGMKLERTARAKFSD